MDLINMDEDLKKKLYWGFVILMGLIAIYTFTRSYFYDKEQANASIAIARQAGTYKLLGFSDHAKNFTVDIQDMKTQEIYKDQFITVDCPLYAKNNPGSVFKMYRITNIRLSDKQQYYTFDGGYDFLCTDKAISQNNNNQN
jgi:hypothetical protein